MSLAKTYKTFYLAGIGGIGMSALARYFHTQKKNVLGYDKTMTKLTKTLASEGIKINYADEISPEIRSLKKKETLVVFTPAIKDLEILNHFKEQGFCVEKRAKVLGDLSSQSTCFAVAGTHGKTTASSILSHLCKEAGLPFSCFLGGISENLGSNFFSQGDEIMVVEADEYDRSFLHLHPSWGIITSTDADHLDIYGSKGEIEKGFEEFASLVKNTSQLFIKKGLKINRRAKTYAVNEEADFFSKDIVLKGSGVSFNFYDNKEKTTFHWDIPGVHNVENATAVIALLRSYGIEYGILQRGLEKFKGIKRRYTKHTFENGKIYIDDYAHHPTELNAVIDSIKTFYPQKKLLVVFQPHLFSRTRDFAEKFAQSLSKANILILLEIYAARELQKDYEGITSSWLLEKIPIRDKKKTNLTRAIEEIKKYDFDILLTAGAGDIDTLSDPITEWLKDGKA
ncbi:MAG: UDP-N-acetylmuramate--L-alanine ligase [Bergeyella sp.]|nr:UDP-N-acetylmuramate--L-alanine ligase [Bergeyella sp.]